MTKLIEKQLERGGLVIANRGTGKTTALVNYAITLSKVSADRVIIVVPASHSVDYMQGIVNKCWPDNIPRPLIVFTQSQLNQKHKSHENILVDEYFYTCYRGAFTSAVGTPPFEIHLAVTCQ